jgi:hypothetical protein
MHAAAQVHLAGTEPVNVPHQVSHFRRQHAKKSSTRRRLLATRRQFLGALRPTSINITPPVIVLTDSRKLWL